jgi:hypothetical protein
VISEILELKLDHFLPKYFRRQEDLEFKASLGKTVPNLSQKQNKNKRARA